MTKLKSLRSAAAVNTALIAAVASGAFLSVYGLASGQTGSGLGTSTQASASSAASNGAGSNASGSATATGNTTPITFTTADTGSCLNWDVDEAGKFSNFQQTSCADDHRFEVSAREDLAIYPTSEFGADAPLPSIERQAQLREELCQGSTLQYLDGKFDPSGKYSIAPILPSAEAWALGDRTMLCGLQTTDSKGIPQVTKGKVSEVDQANVVSAGECRRVDQSHALQTVNCAEPHQMETTAIINLAQQFPQAFPTAEEQNAFLSQRCNDAAIEYLGNEENLYQSTLQPYWGSISESSWVGGTRSVNCSLIHVDPATKSFSTITGSAKGGRTALSINGAPPTAQPSRNPLRPQAGAAGAAASTSAEPHA